MPPNAPVAGVAQVVINGHLNGVPYANVLHIGRLGQAGPLDIVSVTNIAQGVRSAFSGNLLARMSAGFVLESVVATDLTSNTGVSFTATGSNAGSVGNAKLSNNAALVLSWRIARHYRGGHPRTYLAGLTTGDSTDGRTILTAQIALWRTAATGFFTACTSITDPNGGQFLMYALHRVANKQVLGTPLVDQILGVTVDSRIDTQRRRLGKPVP